jgi:hypothetical protein
MQRNLYGQRNDNSTNYTVNGSIASHVSTEYSFANTPKQNRSMPNAMQNTMPNTTKTPMQPKKTATNASARPVDTTSMKVQSNPVQGDSSNTQNTDKYEGYTGNAYLREGIILSEVLGEPVCKKRHRRAWN